MSEKPARKAVGVKAAWQGTLSRLKGNYSDWVAGMLILMVVRLAALLPLLAYFFLGEGSPWRHAALLTPVLYLFVVLPLRYSMGEAMQRALEGGSFSTMALISLRGYGKKLRAMLLQAWHFLPWTVPLILGIWAGWYLTYGVSNGAIIASTILKMRKAYGFMSVILAIVAFYGLLFLVLLYGMMRNGMVRFLWNRKDGYGPARRETLARLRGRRKGQFLVSTLNTLLLLPVLLPCGYMGYRLLREFSKNGRLDLSHMAEPQMLLGIVAVLFVLYLPLLPLRKALPAVFIRQAGDKQ